MMAHHQTRSTAEKLVGGAAQELNEREREIS